MIKLCKGYFRHLKSKVKEAFTFAEKGLEKEEKINDNYFISHVNHLFSMDQRDELKIIDREKKIIYLYSTCLNELVGLATEEDVIKDWEMMGIKIISFEEYIKNQMGMYGWKRTKKPEHTPIDKGLWYKKNIDEDYEVTVVINLEETNIRFKGISFIYVNLISKSYKIPNYEISRIYEILRRCEDNFLSCGVPFALHYNFTGEDKKVKKQRNASLRERVIS